MSKRIAWTLLAFLVAVAPALADVPVDLSDVSPSPDAPAGPPASGPDGGLPGFVFYPDRVSFDAAFPGLPCEDFEEGLVPPATANGAPAPLNATTSNVFFSPGDILPGISFQDDPLNDTAGGSVNGLVFVGSGFFGSTSISVAANTFVDTFEIYFNPPVPAAAMDVVNFVAADTVAVEFLDGSSASLGSVNVVAGTTGTFLGFTSATPVGRIRLTATITAGTGAEGVDNICFLSYQAPLIQQIPTLGIAGLVALALALGLGAFFALRRRRVA